MSSESITAPIANGSKAAQPKAGLEDIVAGTSNICFLDGKRGILAYYGYDIHDLVKGIIFECLAARCTGCGVAR